MPRIGIAFLLCALMSGAALAQSEMSSRLNQEEVGGVQPGSYSAGRFDFSLDAYGDKYLLRFDDDPEIYVLYEEPAPLGGRALKYDSGAIAIRVAAWGGMTLFTDATPGGVAAERTGDSLRPSPGQVSLGDVQNAADDESEHLAYSRGIHAVFTADWVALAGDARMRALCFEAMENAARGIDRFLIPGQARGAFARRIDQVRMALGTKPLMFLSGKTLNITFDVRSGYAGRASSRGIARALGQLLGVGTPG
ncbi:MAG: DUF4908 domain-containing protein [Alphaproteobacteria bacterium]|nr:DUF4908 domain-containing protein [Alphaproteobacteria bacterium]MBV9692444.1 DUF4908 domain-containing protein [Alphaproteobacteria bacterium]